MNNELQLEFEKLLRDSLPALTVEVDAPLKADGEWWFDIEGENGFGTSVSWSPRRGFGIFLGESGYGERPDEIYGAAGLAIQRLRMLLSAACR